VTTARDGPANGRTAEGVPLPFGWAPRPAQNTVPVTGGTDPERDGLAELRASRRPALVVLRGPDLGKRCKLIGSSATVGRDPASSLVLTDPSASWAHARLEDRGDGWTLVDLGSTNGTFVNGAPVCLATIEPADKLRFARTVVRFELQDALELDFGETLERLLNIDELSGLLVRRVFNLELASLLAAARADGSPLGLLVMDLDGIKRINDTHGHLFGAHVIGEAGRLLGTLLASRGIGTRFGGDEFIAALPRSSLAEAESFGGAMVGAMQRHCFVREGIVLHPGISIGAASYPESATSANALFQRADEAMYRAKRGGGNQVSR
jgi:diguanylate cyclase (GGDEF)-like protein